MFAAGRGHERLVKLLIESHADSDLQNRQGLTALMVGCFYGHVAIVEMLLRANATVGLRAATGQTALQCAERAGRSDCVAAMKEHESNLPCAPRKSATRNS